VETSTPRRRNTSRKAARGAMHPWSTVVPAQSKMTASMPPALSMREGCAPPAQASKHFP